MKKVIGILVLVFCFVGFANAREKVPVGYKVDNIVRVVKTIEKDTIWVGHRLDYMSKKPMEKVYTFELSDDAVLSSHAGVWLEKTTKGMSVYKNEGPCYLVKSLGTKTRNWIGQNAFGARTRVETETDTKYFVIPSPDIRKLPVKPKGGKVGVLFIGKPLLTGYPTASYIAYPGQSYAATFDMPYQTVRKYYGLNLSLQEVVVFDKGSGEVLLKYKP
jgi:hypothetical protein